MSKRIAIKDIETAVRIYYLHPELGTSEIKELFNCSSSTATRLKNQVKIVQRERGILTFSDCHVNTRCAYEVWKIDVKDLEEKLVKYRSLWGNQ